MENENVYSVVRFGRKTKSAIWQEARKKVGGFGMWLEVQLRVTDKDHRYYTNRLIRDDDETDLFDFIHWSDFCRYDWELINGHTLLDVPVHNKADGLSDNLLCLLDAKGNLIRSFTIMEACGPDQHKTTNEFLKQYEEK